MKKLLLIGYIVLSTSTLFATLDSSKFVNGWNTTGETVHGVVSIVAPQYSGLVLALFGASSALISLIFAFLQRRATIKKWKENGKLLQE